jgi:hypothetical protein
LRCFGRTNTTTTPTFMRDFMRERMLDVHVAPRNGGP